MLSQYLEIAHLSQFSWKITSSIHCSVRPTQAQYMRNTMKLDFEAKYIKQFSMFPT